MLLFEFSTSSQDICVQVVDGGLKGGSSGFRNPVDILIGDSTGTENSTVSKPLGGEIPDREFGQNNIGTNVMHFLQFFIDDLPLRIHDALEVIDVFDSDLCVFFL